MGEIRETESGSLTLRRLQVSGGKRPSPETNRDPLWTRGCGRGRRVIGAQSWGNKYSLQRSEEALGRRDWSQALARCRIGGGAGKLLCQVGVGVSIVRGRGVHSEGRGLHGECLPHLVSPLLLCNLE